MNRVYMSYPESVMTSMLFDMFCRLKLAEGEAAIWIDETGGSQFYLELKRTR